MQQPQPPIIDVEALPDIEIYDDGTYDIIHPKPVVVIMPKVQKATPPTRRVKSYSAPAGSLDIEWRELHENIRVTYDAPPLPPPILLPQEFDDEFNLPEDEQMKDDSEEELTPEEREELQYRRFAEFFGLFEDEPVEIGNWDWCQEQDMEAQAEFYRLGLQELADL